MRVLRVVLFFLSVVLLGVSIYFAYDYYHLINEEKVVDSSISDLRERSSSLDEEIVSINEEIVSLRDDKVEEIREYENWIRQNQKLEEEIAR